LGRDRPAARQARGKPKRVKVKPEPFIPDTGATLPIKEVIAAVCEAFRTSEYYLTGAERARPIAWARQAAMTLLRRYTATGQLSLPAVARMIGRADHTTVGYGIAACQRRLETCPKFRVRYEEAEAAILARIEARARKGGEGG